MWQAIASQYQEFFSGELVQPTAKITSPYLAIVFSALKEDRDIWSGSTILVRAYWEWVTPEGTEKIYTSAKRIWFNDRFFLSFDGEVQIPYQIEFSLNADADSIFYSIWQDDIAYASNQYTAVIEEFPQLILPKNSKRDSIFIENGGTKIFLGFAPGNLHLAVEPGYSIAFEPGTIGLLGEVWGATNTDLIAELKITEISKI